jgi:hypothetical protein
MNSLDGLMTMPRRFQETARCRSTTIRNIGLPERAR